MRFGGIVCVRNGNKLDYCWQEAVKSLLPVCDNVVICIGSGGDDDTEKEAREWSFRDPKILICVYDWPNPKGDIDFWVNWLQYARQHVPQPYLIQLDGDEVLSENSYEEIEQLKHRPGQFSVWCKRYNFWTNAQSLIPHGYCCSHILVRISPQHVWLPSDGVHAKGAEAIRMAVNSNIEIFHYGFLRKRDAWFKKARGLHDMFFGTYDSRLEAAEKYDGQWSSMPGLCGGWESQLVPYTGSHPKVAHQWLTDRGYKI
jgi:hypothetical protein